MLLDDRRKTPTHYPLQVTNIELSMLMGVGKLLGDAIRRATGAVEGVRLRNGVEREVSTVRYEECFGVGHHICGATSGVSRVYAVDVLV